MAHRSAAMCGKLYGPLLMVAGRMGIERSSAAEHVKVGSACGEHLRDLLL
jgi:hypothetical protein